jgi:hypothetical protein
MNTLCTMAYDDDGDLAHSGGVLGMARWRRRSSVNRIEEKIQIPRGFRQF